jgi:hypothetical protein
MAIASAGPDWLGSPQHVIGGVCLALALVLAARWLGTGTWLAVALALGAVSMVELLIEIAEYPLLYSDKFHYSAYYDTVADLASTLVGGLIGIPVGLALARLWRPKRLVRPSRS